ncbi:MAG: cupin domain-containing protein [Verrucomicrobiota bacterium]
MTNPAQTSRRPFAHANFGSFDDLLQYQSHGLRGKCFVSEALDTNGAEVSLNRLPAGTGMSFLHRHHRHEEIYIVTRGTGQFVVDGDVFEVREGSVVRIDPPAARSLRASDNDDLHYICIQATSGTLSARQISDGEEAEGDLPWPAIPSA